MEDFSLSKKKQGERVTERMSNVVKEGFPNCGQGVLRRFPRSSQNERWLNFCFDFSL